MFSRQVEYDWDDAQTDYWRQFMLQDHLDQFLEREKWIDQRFARGRQADVPRALTSIATREFAQHGLEGHLPVLTVGPPDGFETHESDLFEHLLGGLSLVDEDESLTPLRTPKLSIISVPYIEGTRALWYPITLGHELAHVRLDKRKKLTARVALTEGFVPTDRVDDWEALQEQWDQRAQDDPPLAQVLERWVNELLCDLNAVRICGLAGVSAIAEFLAVLDASATGEAEEPTVSHPPASVRLACLFHFVDALGYRDLPDHVRVWRDYLASAQRRFPWPFAFIAGLVTDETNVDRLIAHVREWGKSYEADGTAGVTEWVTHELLDGIPGGTHFALPDGSCVKVSAEDVVNAAWEARSALDHAPINGEASRSAPAILRSGLDHHEMRLRVDELATKAIDSIELARLWGDKRGVIGTDGNGIPRPATLPFRARQAFRPPGWSRHNRARKGAIGPPSRDRLGAVVLSGRQLSGRLTAGRGDSRRLVVTPLFEDTIQAAGLDVRLGPDFIVFRHSAIAAFDPLADEDPRMLQERVHKAWGEKFILHPGELVLAATLEYIVIPDDVVAQVLTRSSYGRLGLITATAVQVQPGSRGCITLELVNLGETPIALSPGARVAQLILSGLQDPDPVRPGRYWFPTGPEFSKVSKDRDAEPLREIVAATRVQREPSQMNVTFRVRRGHDTYIEDVAYEYRLRLIRRGDVPPVAPLPAMVPDEEPEFVIVQGRCTVIDLAKLVYRMTETWGSGARAREAHGQLEISLLAEPRTETLLVGLLADGAQFARVPADGTEEDIEDVLARMRGRSLTGA
jgi:deoxycytidine triphosphate deaminase